MGFLREEYWSELPFPSPGDLLDPEIEPRSPALKADSLLIELPSLWICPFWTFHINGTIQYGAGAFCLWLLSVFSRFTHIVISTSFLY